MAQNSIIAFLRRGDDPKDFILVCCNFTPVPRQGLRVRRAGGGLLPGDSEYRFGVVRRQQHGQRRLRVVARRAQAQPAALDRGDAAAPGGGGVQEALSHGREVRFHHHRRRPQRPGCGRLPGARRAQGAGAGAARTGGRLRGHRRDLAGLSRLHRRLPHQPAAGAHRPGTGTGALRLPGGRQGSRLLLRVSRRAPFLHVAGSRQDAGRNRQVLAARCRSLPGVRRSAGAPLAGGGRPAADHAAAVPAARHRFRGLPEARREDARPGPARHRGAGQDLHAERGGVSRRVVRIRGSESHAGHRRRDRRQRRTALAGHGLHPAASLHGRRGRTSRAVGFRARRHGRGVGGDRGIGARQGRGDPRERAGREGAGARRPGARRGAGKRRRDRGRARWRRISIPSSPSCACWTPRISTPEFVRAIRNFRIEGTSCKINLALNGLPEFTRLPRRAGPAPQGDDAHLPQHRIRGARLGRRQVRPRRASARCWS